MWPTSSRRRATRSRRCVKRSRCDRFEDGFELRRLYRRLGRGSRDGLGDDWPISYGDVAPYYDKIDRLIGIFGSKENLPNEPNGVFLLPPKPRCYELLVKQAADKLRITCIPARLSILTRPLNGRAACHYCGQCNRGCRVNANFTSTNVLIAPALATGKLTLVTNAMA